MSFTPKIVSHYVCLVSFPDQTTMRVDYITAKRSDNVIHPQLRIVGLGTRVMTDVLYLSCSGLQHRFNANIVTYFSE